MKGRAEMANVDGRRLTTHSGTQSSQSSAGSIELDFGGGSTCGQLYNRHFARKTGEKHNFHRTLYQLARRCIPWHGKEVEMSRRQGTGTGTSGEDQITYVPRQGGP